MYSELQKTKINLTRTLLNFTEILFEITRNYTVIFFFIHFTLQNPLKMFFKLIKFKWTLNGIRFFRIEL
jgi:hypothetical protein